MLINIPAWQHKTGSTQPAVHDKLHAPRADQTRVTGVHNSRHAPAPAGCNRQMQPFSSTRSFRASHTSPPLYKSSCGAARCTGAAAQRDSLAAASRRRRYSVLASAVAAGGGDESGGGGRGGASRGLGWRVESATQAQYGTAARAYLPRRAAGVRGGFRLLLVSVSFHGAARCCCAARQASAAATGARPLLGGRRRPETDKAHHRAPHGSASRGSGRWSAPRRSSPKCGARGGSRRRSRKARRASGGRQATATLREPVRERRRRGAGEATVGGGWEEKTPPPPPRHAPGPFSGRNEPREAARRGAL